MGIVVMAVLVGPQGAHAAENVYLFLQIDGKAVKGDSTAMSMGRQNSIECRYFEEGATPTGQMAVVIRKRIDQSSALLQSAAFGKKPVSAIFKLYRPNPAGDGTTQQFYRIEGSAGQILSVKTTVRETLDPPGATSPALEEVRFSFKNLGFFTTNGPSWAK
jgi:type VI secretion system secreted protein Hcp